MGYNEEDEELDRIRRASARRKRELEELQREELRRIRELEQRKQEKKMREQRREERPRTRTFDPDQAVSDEDYNNSYEERRRRPRNPQPRYEEDEYDEDFEEADDRETRRERQQKQAKRNARRRKRKKSPAARFFKTFFIVLLVLFLIFFFAVWNITRRFNHVESEVSKRPAAGKHQVVNILLIGQDAREGEEGQRSDSIILLSVNAKKNKVAMTSIMRDTYVQIPGHGGNRINAAYAYGGIDLLDQTIEENFGITIDGNAMVDFDGFLEAMTAVGNMDMELTAEEAQYMNENPGFGSNNDASDEVWNLQPGVNNLTPSQLLAYSRIRYVGNSDWDRTERQRKVISGAVSKVKHGHFISGYNMATEAAPSITTDMKTFGMLRVASGIMTGGEMKSHLIPVEGTYYGDYIDGMAVLVPDIEANKNYLQGYINGED
ncbi:MAG: LCP family protein [Eubacterium sp.]|nr:LCP family protein [Eubacterium sp.]